MLGLMSHSTAEAKHSFIDSFGQTVDENQLKYKSVVHQIKGSTKLEAENCLRNYSLFHHHKLDLLHKHITTVIRGN